MASFDPEAALAPLDGDATALLFGSRWVLDAGRTLRYSFAGEASLWDAVYLGGEPSQGFAGLAGDAERQAVRDALFLWSAVTDVRFEEVADDASGCGTLRIGYTTLGMDGSQLAYSYAPNDSANGGDVWLNADLRNALYGSFSAGSLASYVVLHELGHALGLKHPHAASTLNVHTLPGPEDSLFGSVMSYYAWPGVTLTQTNIDRLPTTPMSRDIDALQSLYGANAGSHGGDDVYLFDGEGRYLETIYDTGGADAIRVTGTRDAEIDLRPDEWSRIGVPVQIDGGAIQAADTVRIYRSSLIENAFGGEGNDALIGNALDNVLEGRGGDDTLDGGAAIDTVRFSGDRADYTIASGLGGYLVADGVAGRDGIDALSGIERLEFADATVMVVTVQVYEWKSHALLTGVVMAGALGGADGSYAFVASGQTMALAPQREVECGEAAAVDAADAVAILRMIVGLEIDGGHALSPYQALAADYDGSGLVELTDAIGVLKHAEGMVAPLPRWVFVGETDATMPGRAGLTPGELPATLSVDVAAHAGLVGILRGDADGSWTAPAGNQSLGADYFASLVATLDMPGVTLAQWGIYS